MTLDELEALLEDSEALVMEPRASYDAAIVGYLDTLDVLVYSAPKVLQILQRQQGMDAEGAQEWFDFNIAGCRGDRAPVYLWPLATPKQPRHPKKDSAMKAMKTLAAKPMPVPAGKKAAAKPAPAAQVMTARPGKRAAVVQKPHNPDNHVSRMPGFANGGMVGNKKKC